MASPNAIATKTANAVRTIQTASTALANKLNIEITSFPVVPKRYDPDYARAVQLSHLADVLQKIAVATNASKDGDFNNEAPQVVEIVEPEPAVDEVIEAPVETVENESVAPKRKRK